VAPKDDRSPEPKTKREAETSFALRWFYSASTLTGFENWRRVANL